LGATHPGERRPPKDLDNNEFARLGKKGAWGHWRNAPTKKKFALLEKRSVGRGWRPLREGGKSPLDTPTSGIAMPENAKGWGSTELTRKKEKKKKFGGSRGSARWGLGGFRVSHRRPGADRSDYVDHSEEHRGGKGVQKLTRPSKARDRWAAKLGEGAGGAMGGQLGFQTGGIPNKCCRGGELFSRNCRQGPGMPRRGEKSRYAGGGEPAKPFRRTTNNIRIAIRK